MNTATVVDVNAELGIEPVAPPLPRAVARRAGMVEVRPLMVAGALVGVSLAPWPELPSSMDGASPAGGA